MAPRPAFPQAHTQPAETCSPINSALNSECLGAAPLCLVKRYLADPARMDTEISRETLMPVAALYRFRDLSIPSLWRLGAGWISMCQRTLRFGWWNWITSLLGIQTRSHRPTTKTASATLLASYSSSTNNRFSSIRWIRGGD